VRVWRFSGRNAGARRLQTRVQWLIARGA